MKEAWRRWKALIAASLVAPILATTLSATLLAMLVFPELIFQAEVSSGVYRDASVREIATSLVGFGLMGLVFGVMLGWPAMAIGGVPMHAFLVRIRRTGFSMYALSGALLGTLVMLIYFFGTSGFRDPVSVLTSGPILLSGPVAGLLTAAQFWLIRRPDQIDLS
ncbi:hypothetical protein HY29_02585 [Hyphomonas beringensis]|uniref:Uncharacterized protein n=1 Tax=Hyphomonas beringensis TaxID=1280946 RepID=A0A062UBI0_9PROT|nr:hypothetical protein [Hyphomonas beringensis]KCZ53974.1 hypothetical protein HY29_02585 [Hyphomonas beringensis]